MPRRDADEVRRVVSDALKRRELSLLPVKIYVFVTDGNAK
jgi:hypothetical protein